MPNTTIKYRDGTSQFNRTLQALDPGQVAIDDRGIADWLTFAQEYAGELRFFNLRNEPEGLWTPLLYSSRPAYEAAKKAEEDQAGDPGDWPSNWRKTIEKYLEDPRSGDVTEQQQALISKPHFALFLTFLKLLQILQGQVNTIPQRHLEFYFREFLQILKKAPRPDQVHVLFELTKGARQVRLPKGTALDAGAAPNGQPIVYATDRETFLNQAHIAQSYNLFASREGPVYAIPDPAAAQSEIGGAPTWKTFGRRPGPEDGDTIQTGRIGLSIASPLLYLEGGFRIISLDIHFATELAEELRGQIDKDTFTFWLSTAEGMQKVQPKTLPITETPAILKLTLELPEDFPSVVPLPTEEVERSQLPGSLPVLAMLLNPKATPNTFTLYPELRELKVRSIDLAVDVGNLTQQADLKTGLPNILLQNDVQVIDPKKPFEPFTDRPAKGGGFYLSHPEIAAKPLNELQFTLNWANLPVDSDGSGELAAYYQDYWAVEGRSAPSEFLQADVCLHDQNSIYNLPKPKDIFDKAVHGVNFSDVASTLQKLPRQTFIQNGNEALQAVRLIILRLKSGLGYDRYPVLLNKQIREGLKPENQRNNWWNTTLNPPYIPQLLSVDLRYTTSTTYDLAEPDAIPADDHLFHLHPFGYRRIDLEADVAVVKNEIGEEQSGIAFLPVYGRPIPDPSDPEKTIAVDSGKLYLGLENLQPPQTLSLLFQLVEGSANPESPRPKVQWSVLSGDHWVELNEGGWLLTDETMNLLRSGMVQLSIPEEASTQHDLLPAGLHWLRAQVEAWPDAVCDTLAVHTQAVSATLLDPESVPGHLERPLPKEQVKGLKRPIGGVAKVLQPYTSFGGRPVEEDDQYYTRVSERLRHKKRAVSLWDYERLTLEYFPEIYRVKCLPPDTADEAGTVKLIVIPDIRGGRPYDPFQPRAPAGTLESIRQFLQAHAPGSAKVEVYNPLFDQVQARVLVALKPGYIEADYYRAQIDLAIQRFLSPWAFDPDTDLVFGGRLYVSLLVNYIEEIEYVDYVKNLYIKKTNSDRGEVVSIDGTKSYLEASSHRHMLVSDRFHHVLILPSEPEAQVLKGINYMVVEFDFRVGEDK